MPNNAPHSVIDMPEVMSRNMAARDIVSGFASAMPTLSVAWHHLQAALADTRDLAAEAGAPLKPVSHSHLHRRDHRSPGRAGRFKAD